MEIKTFSPKQAEILQFAYNDEETLICDGAVRSGKTIVMTLSFVLWAMTYFNHTNFAICGKTVSNAERNILRPFQQIEGMPFTLNYKISNRMLTVQSGDKENYFYLFGGKDESSYALIQGLTLAGVLFDEVALMPQSFVDQAIARTLSFANAKIWFNCNPESPNHWFYKEWITNEERKYKHLHFLMRDNPILTEKEIQRAESLFTGVFYDRYIRGMWVRAEGIIFPEFANSPDRWIIKREDVPKRFRSVCVGFDIGGNGSAYAMTATGEGLDKVQYKLKAKKWQAQDLDIKHIEKFVKEFCEDVENKYNVVIERINSDHIDAIINTLNNNTKYRVGKAYKPPLEDRVVYYSKFFGLDKVKFVKGECDDLIEELQNLVFDDNSDRMIPLDDGSMQIDTWDSNIYSESSYWNYLKV